jgi:hypothetical protein
LLLGAPHVAIAHEVIVAEIEAVDLGAITPAVGLTALVDSITRVVSERIAVMKIGHPMEVDKPPEISIAPT